MLSTEPHAALQSSCIWMATKGSSLRLLPKTSTGDVTSSLPPSHINTHALSLSPSLPPSLLLSLPPRVSWLESSSDSVQPTSGSETQTQSSRPSSLCMNQVQPKYVCAKGRWPAQKGKRTASLILPLHPSAPSSSPPLPNRTLLSGWSMSSCPEGPF